MKANLKTVKADESPSIKPYKPATNASFSLEGKHAGMPLPKVGDKVAVRSIGKVKSVSMDHYGESDPSARFSLDVSDLAHEPFKAVPQRKSLTNLINARQAKNGTGAML